MSPRMLALCALVIVAAAYASRPFSRPSPPPIPPWLNRMVDFDGDVDFVKLPPFSTGHVHVTRTSHGDEELFDFYEVSSQLNATVPTPEEAVRILTATEAMCAELQRRNATAHELFTRHEREARDDEVLERVRTLRRRHILHLEMTWDTLACPDSSAEQRGIAKTQDKAIECENVHERFERGVAKNAWTCNQFADVYMGIIMRSWKSAFARAGIAALLVECIPNVRLDQNVRKTWLTMNKDGRVPLKLKWGGYRGAWTWKSDSLKDAPRLWRRQWMNFYAPEYFFGVPPRRSWHDEAGEPVPLYTTPPGQRKYFVQCRLYGQRGCPWYMDESCDLRDQDARCKLALNLFFKMPFHQDDEDAYSQTAWTKFAEFSAAYNCVGYRESAMPPPDPSWMVSVWYYFHDNSWEDTLTPIALYGLSGALLLLCRFRG